MATPTSGAPATHRGRSGRTRDVAAVFATLAALALLVVWSDGGLLGMFGRATGASADPAAPATEGIVDADGETVRTPAIPWRGRSSWQIAKQSTWANLTEAYADQPSYLPGQQLRLAVHTSSPTYQVTLWRLGATPKLVGRSRRLPALRQPAATVDWRTGLVRAPWTFTWTFSIPTGWRSGIYLARVAGTDGAQAYVPFVVRSTRRGDLLFVVNTLTDAAYNQWGGNSLYRLARPGSDLTVSHALQVSLDRPNRQEDGAGTVFQQAWPLARWLEQSGYDVTYTTDWDLSRSPTTAPLPRAIVFAGHSEYWSQQLRAWLDLHVSTRGDVGLALLGANSGYWPIRLSRDGRTITCYKEASTLPGYLPAAAQPSASGAPSASIASPPLPRPDRLLRFRDPPLTGTGPSRPEQLLFGAQYGSIPNGAGEYVLGAGVGPDLLTGTGLAPGQSLGDIVGGEADAVDPNVPIAPDQVTIASGGYTDIYGSPHTADAVFRPLPGGHAVFAAGSFLWTWGLDPGYEAAHGVPAGVTTLTRNILARTMGRPIPPPPSPSPSASASPSESPSESEPPSDSEPPSASPLPSPSESP